MADQEDNKQEDTDVRSEEVTGAPLNEDGESIGQNNEDVEEQAVPRKVRLQWRKVRQAATRDILGLEGGHEAQMADVDARPADEASDGSNVQEPVKNNTTVGRQVHVGEQTDGRGSGNCKVGSSEPVGVGHELRSAPLVGKRNKNAGARVDVGVGGGENGGQEHSIDDVGQNLDTSQVGSDDQGRRGGILRVEQKRWVVGRHNDTDEEDGRHEQAEDAPESPADGTGNALLGVLGLTSTNTNQLGPLETEAGGDQDGPEANELANGTLNNGLVERTRAHPVLEAQVPLLANTGVDADGKDDEADNGNDLDAGEPHLNFTKNANGHEVESSEDDPEDTDKDGNAQAVVPVLDNDTSSSQLESESDGPAEPVHPAHGEAESGVDES